MPPLAKRSTERRRTNKVPGQTIIKADGEVKPARLPRGLHPVARAWFNAMKASAQNEYFESSDWQAAVVVAMKLSAHLASSSLAERLRDLVPLVESDDVKEQLLEIAAMMPTGTAAEFAAVWSAMNDLLTTEASRRRAHLEIERVAPQAVATKPQSIEERWRELA